MSSEYAAGTKEKVSNAVNWLPTGFVLAAAALLAFWLMWLSAYVVQRAYVAGDTAATSGGRLDSIWSWLLLAGLLWGVLNIFWAMRALRLYRISSYRGHWLVAILCGLAVLGIQAVMAARTLTLDPIILDYSNSDTKVQALPASAAISTVAGDPALGLAVFGKACITCHGPTGGGLPNLAPSLVGSEFVESSDNSAVAKVIRQGRGIEDSNNKTKKVMPARGGNPFLTEADISHLVAFIRKIQSQPVSSGAASDSIQLANWVVPNPKRPASDLDWKIVSTERNAGLHRAEQLANRRVAMMRWLTLGLTTVHALFFTCVLIVSSGVVLPQMLSGHSTLHLRRASMAIAGWIIATVSWGLIAWLCFWWS
ncbi:MAG: cytochrome c [Planctomycetales bacterium]|nr:cytochrome c [Planctomycetales bacterium]